MAVDSANKQNFAFYRQCMVIFSFFIEVQSTLESFFTVSPVFFHLGCGDR